MTRGAALLVLILLILVPAPAAAQVPPQIFYVLGALAGLLEIAIGYKKTLDEIQAMKSWVQYVLSTTLERVEMANNETLREVAEQLKEIRELLDETEKRVYDKLNKTLAEIHQLLAQAERLLNKTRAEARRALEQVNSTIQYYNMLYSSVREQIKALSKELNETKNVLAVVQERLERLERLSREIGWDRLHAMLEEYNRTVSEAIRGFEEAREEVLAFLARVNGTLALLESRVEEHGRELEELNATLREVESVLEAKAEKRDVEALRGLVESLNTQIAALRTALQRIEADYVSRQQLAAVESRIAAIESRVGAYEASFNSFRQEFYQFHMVIGVGFVVAVVVAAIAYAAARRPKELLRQLRRLEEQLAQTEAAWQERMQRLCGLDKDAQVLLDALAKGEISIVCRDGKPATVIGGKIVCLEKRKA